MAREAQGARTEWVEYVPNVESNREDPEPFTVEVSPMTAIEMTQFERGLGDMTGGSQNFMARAQQKVRELFEKRVRCPRRYSITHHKTGEKLTPLNAKQLYNAIMEHGDETEKAIIDDIIEAIKVQTHLRAGLLETLRSRSESAAEEMTTSSAGAAGGVDA